MKYPEEYKMEGSYLVLCGEEPVRTDIDDYLIKRYKSIKNKAELELETCEMHGELNPATNHAKADAQTKLNFVNHLLEIKEKVRWVIGI